MIMPVEVSRAMSAVFTVVLSIPINILLWPVSKNIWSTFVHQVLLEQARDAELAYKIILYALDLGMAVALMASMGLLLAAACVQTVANALSRQ